MYMYLSSKPHCHSLYTSEVMEGGGGALPFHPPPPPKTKKKPGLDRVKDSAAYFCTVNDNAEKQILARATGIQLKNWG